MLSLFLVLFFPAVSCVFYNILFFGDWTLIAYLRLEKDVSFSTANAIA